MRGLFFRAFGGPDVLKFGELPDPVERPGCAIVKMHAIGLNFADVYRRRGSYHLAGNPPWILGYEGAGTVESIAPPLEAAGAVAPAAWTFSVGDRVAFADAPFANAERVSVPLERLVPVPAELDLDTAAAVLLQGLTAQYLIRDSHRLQSGEVALVHAAAGGVGLLLVQLARSAGARVIGLTSNESKRLAALEAGADTVLLYGADWLEGVRAATSGRGVDVAFDSVGSTLATSLAATRIGGHAVFFGMAGGDPEPIDPRLLMDGSKSLTGGDL
ncbi:MAG: zinc-binding dehydrogenase, partial [Thermoanaerobaculia bacterium]